MAEPTHHRMNHNECRFQYGREENVLSSHYRFSGRIGRNRFASKRAKQISTLNEMYTSAAQAAFRAETFCLRGRSHLPAGLDPAHCGGFATAVAIWAEDNLPPIIQVPGLICAEVWAGRSRSCGRRRSMIVHPKHGPGGTLHVSQHRLFPCEFRVLRQEGSHQKRLAARAIGARHK